MFIFAPIQRDLECLQKAINDVFGQTASSKEGYPVTEAPFANVEHLEDGQLQITLPLPGMSQQEIEISLEQGKILVRGNRKTDHPENSKVLRSERDFGTYFRMIELPYRIDPNSIKATLNHGILYIQASQAEEDKPRKIVVS